jgi:HD-GYP domain-containing protein (c-di-GMP phosphodiesterase class II)
MDLAKPPTPRLFEQIQELYVCFDVEELRSLDRQLRQLDDAHAANHLDEMWRIVGLHVLNGVAQEGLPLATKAIRCARKLGDLLALRRLLNTRGEVHRQSGDLAHAIEDYVEAYEVASAIDSPLARLSTLCNLATIPHELGLTKVAEAICVHAHRELSECDASDQRFALLNAVVLANLGGAALWSNPSRSVVVSEQSLVAAEALPEADPLLRLHKADLVVRARLNSLIAYILLGNVSAAQRYASTLEEAVGYQVSEDLKVSIRAALGAFVAKFVNPDAGLRQLRQAIAAGQQSVGSWIESARLLVHILQELARDQEAAATLRRMYRRLQTLRRQIAVEELRRIDLDLPMASVERELDNQLVGFAIGSMNVEAALFAKIGHLERIALTAELREGSEASRVEHIYRVGRLCTELATEIGCSEEIQWLAEIAGRLHDIGKCAVPDDVILSANTLSELHRSILNDHAEYGARLIADADEPRLVQVVSAVRHHHERFDGTGYPNGLRGEEIPLLARIVAICESFDAMLQSRAYRDGRSIPSALIETERCAGAQFDALLAGLLVRVVRRIMRDHSDVVGYLGSQAHAAHPARALLALEELSEMKLP